MNIQTFVFNSFQLNTYLIYDETNEGIIIDAGNYEESENEILFNFIKTNKINIKGLYYTHAHIDHILGNNAIINNLKVESYAHIDSIRFMKEAKDYARTFGFAIEDIILAKKYINEGYTIRFGNSELSVIHCPGHVDGSLCFYSEKNDVVFVGDVLFNGSIGRTDLPTGDYDTLINNIQTKLYSLPNGTKVYPGHGPQTSIGYEKLNNPFVKGI